MFSREPSEFVPTRRVAGLAFLTSVVLVGSAAFAVADTTSISDPKGDVAGKQRKSFDVVSAIGRHQGNRLRHDVLTRGRADRRSALLGINTKGGDNGKAEFIVTRKGVFKTRKGSIPAGAKPVAPARLKRTNRKRLAFIFTEAAIGKPLSYGWRIGFFDGASFDAAPDSEDPYETHQLAGI